MGQVVTLELEGVILADTLVEHREVTQELMVLVNQKVQEDLEQAQVNGLTANGFHLDKQVNGCHLVRHGLKYRRKI